MIDYGAVGLFATFLVSFMYFPARALLQDRLIGPASSCLVAMEQVCKKDPYLLLIRLQEFYLFF